MPSTPALTRLFGDRPALAEPATFRIRRDQIEAFSPTLKSLLVQRIHDHLLDAHPRAALRTANHDYSVSSMPATTAVGLISRGLDRAESYGLTWESNLMAFVVTMVLAAPNFDEHPDIRQILKRESMDPDLRFDHLWEETSDATWKEVQERYDPRAWSGAEAHHA
jgi:hypothetical protein